MRGLMLVACLAVAAPAGAEECKVDEAVVSAQFKEALGRLSEYQSYAHLCSGAIGSSPAQAGITMIRGFLYRSGYSERDAVIGADDVDKAAQKQVIDADMKVKLSEQSTAAATRCLEAMNEARELYEVAQAKMLKAGCAP